MSSVTGLILPHGVASGIAPGESAGFALTHEESQFLIATLTGLLEQATA